MPSHPTTGMGDYGYDRDEKPDEPKHPGAEAEIAVDRIEIGRSRVWRHLDRIDDPEILPAARGDEGDNREDVCQFVHQLNDALNVREVFGLKDDEGRIDLIGRNAIDDIDA